jgi:uncharacterized membrane protein HdeD (DUF308 family)
MKGSLKDISIIASIILILVGTLWLLQGINILPGSFMSGSSQWTINGLISLAIGAGLFWFANRK